MKRFAWSVWAVCAVTASAIFGTSMAMAQAKPMAVLSVKGVEEIVGDVKYVMELVGQGEMTAVVDVAVGGFSQGLDPKRPIGVVLYEEGGQVSGLGMLPVTDFKQVLATVTMQTGPPEDLGNGLYEFAGPQPVYAKESNGWVYVSNIQSHLENPPADPAALLDGLNQQYDIALRAIVENVPQAFKDLAMQQLEANLATQLENIESAEERATQEKMVQAQVDNLKTLLNDTQQFTLGINIDRDAETARIDVAHVAVAGTKTANQYAASKDARTAFSGFRNDDAAVNARFVSIIDPSDIQTTINALQPAREQALKGVREDEDIPNEEARQLAVSLVTQLFDLVEATIKTGKLDGGATLLLNNQKLTFLSGMHVADGKKVEAALDEIVALGSQEPDFPGVTKNADRIGNVALHTMSIPVPEDEGDARKLLGENLDVVLGIAPEAAYVAFGDDALNQLKRAIEGSQTESAGDTPVYVNVSIGRILQFASHFDDDPMLATFAKAFQEHAGNDSVVLSMTLIENGCNSSIEIQSGVLKSVGSVMAQEAGAGPGF